MCDHVEGFEIVLANGEHKKIWRPNSPTRKLIVFPEDIAKENDDLFWAVMGGSPGTFGVLTHVQIRPLHDAKFLGSHAMKVATPYTKEKLEKCVQIMAEMSDDHEFPRNFDYYISVATDIANSFYFKRSVTSRETLTRDQEMLLHYPEHYSDGVPWAEEGKLKFTVLPIPVIFVYFQWSNVDGGEGCFGEKETKWFETIRSAIEPVVLDVPKNQANGSPKLHDMHLFLKALLPESHPHGSADSQNQYEHHVDRLRYTDPLPMSQLTRYWTMEDAREYVMPYEKRAYLSDKTDLSKIGWSKWLSERVDVIADGYRGDDSLGLVIQIHMIGGKHSQIHRIAAENPEDSSHSWRTETTMLQALDGFYDPQEPKALPALLKWHEENDKEAKEGGIFCEKDRRYLSGAYYRPDDKDGGASLDSVWDKYFDSREKYERLVEIKRRVDPEYVFSANLFGVDASNAPENKKMAILPMGQSGDETSNIDISYLDVSI